MKYREFAAALQSSSLVEKVQQVRGWRVTRVSLEYH
jgi:hypothetical protein